MAEEAFALSPISASAASPTDADYHAIREAFMETARGRWFLNEYAKRNRNADTAMVLEAVARIEQSIGAAHQEAAAADSPETFPEAALAALENARTAIREQFSETGFDHTLLPWRKSARIIREIVWGLRESGADPRICNILDGQVRAIEAACDEFPLAAIRDRILAALDAALPQDEAAVLAMAESTAEAPDANIVEDTAPACTVQPPEPVAAVAEAGVMGTAIVEAVVIEAAAEPVAAPETRVAEIAVPEAAVPEAALPEAVISKAAVSEVTNAEAPLVEAAVAEAVTAKIETAMEIIAPAAPETPAAETALIEEVASEVEALLATAAETSPAPAEAVADLPQADPAPAQNETAPAAPAPRSIMTASATQPMPQPMAEHAPAEAATVAMANPPQAEPAPAPVPESAATESNGPEDLWADIESEIAPLPPFDPVHEASLGASLIAQGVVARPSNGRPDPLEPIRRMSHAERIAFFS